MTRVRTRVIVAAGALAVALAASVSLLTAVPRADVPAGISASQKHAATMDNLDARWSALTSGVGLERPRVAIVRYTNYLNFGPTVASCLNRDGYGVRWTAKDGIVAQPLRLKDQFPYQRARFLCESQYPQEPAELGYLSQQQARYLFDYWESSLVPCLRSQGITVADIPPIADSRGGYRLVGPALNPYSHVLSSPKGMIVSLLYGRCPPFPAALYGAPESAR
jgi:hypothetical protein